MLKNGTVVTKVVKAEVRISVFKMIKDLNTLGTGCCDIATKIKEVERNRFPCYNANVTASDTGDRKEVSSLDTITSFLVAVMAGVVCHYTIKWLDGDK
mgnify:CR=1 FL=1